MNVDEIKHKNVRRKHPCVELSEVLSSKMAVLNKSMQDVWVYLKLDDNKAENKMSSYFTALQSLYLLWNTVLSSDH